MANSNKNVNIKLTRQQQKQIEDAAYTSAKMFMGLSNKSKAAVLIAIGIVLAVIAAWYLFIAPKAQAPDSPATVAAVSASQRYDYTEWSEQIAPNYYRIDGAAIMTHQLKPGDIEYGGLDQYGRAIYAVGYITGEMYKKELDEPREKNLPKPAGYKNLYVGSSPAYNTTIIGPGIYYWNGVDYEGAFYNRSHLLADSLCGDPTKENLITGTRSQNTGTNNEDGSGYGGMAFSEEIARQYLDSHPDGAIYYAVTPVYHEDELLPRSVFVDVLSDDGVVNMHIETYNFAKGYEIDYASGNAKAVG